MLLKAALDDSLEKKAVENKYLKIDHEFIAVGVPFSEC